MYFLRMLLSNEGGELLNRVWIAHIELVVGQLRCGFRLVLNVFQALLSPMRIARGQVNQRGGRGRLKEQLHASSADAFVSACDNKDGRCRGGHGRLIESRDGLHTKKQGSTHKARDQDEITGVWDLGEITLCTR